MCALCYTCVLSIALWKQGCYIQYIYKGAHISLALFYGMEVQCGFLAFDYWVCMGYLPYQ